MQPVTQSEGLESLNPGAVANETAREYDFPPPQVQAPERKNAALLRRWQRSATSRRVMVERLRHANFCLNIGPALRNGDTTAAPGSKRRNAELVQKSMSDNRAMQLSRLVDELTEAAKRPGLEVRRERILREVGYRARGGACRLREKYLIIIDRDQPPSEQIEVLGRGPT